VVAAPDVATPDVATGTSAPADLSSSPAVTSTPAIVAPAAPSWLEQLRTRGIDLGGDEAKAVEQLGNLYQERQRLQPIIPYANAYMQHAPQFSEWLKQRQQQSAPAAPAAKEQDWYTPYWSPPEFNPNWERQVTRDPQTGALVAAPGAPPDVVPKYTAYLQYRQEAMEKFISNPFEFMAPAIRQLAQKEAQSIVDGKFSQTTELASSAKYVQDNSSWLYNLGADGKPVMTQTFNPMTGQTVMSPALSEWGNVFLRCVQEEETRQRKYGYVDVDEQRRFAEARVSRMADSLELQKLRAAATTPAAPATNPQQAANDAFLKANNPGGKVPATRGNTTVAAKPATRANFREELAQVFQGGGGLSTSAS